jgi:DNA invertase Pin-like site-specific DNA recombinase
MAAARSAIVVWRFDRFARSTKHLLLALEEFRSLGVQFISYQENIDTSSPLGQALFTIVSEGRPIGARPYPRARDCWYP